MKDLYWLSGFLESKRFLRYTYDIVEQPWFHPGDQESGRMSFNKIKVLDQAGVVKLSNPYGIHRFECVHSVDIRSNDGRTEIQLHSSANDAASTPVDYILLATENE